MAEPRTVAVLGAGKQGTAAAFDLAVRGGFRVLLADRDEARLAAAAGRVEALAGPGACRTESADLADPDAIARLLADGGAAGCLSALPYPLNPGAARACLEAGCHHADMGGDPVSVGEVLALDAEARKAGVSVVPDTGLAPGLSNLLAALSLVRVPDAVEVRIRCGGLPVEPEGPLGYALVFSAWGLTREYTGEAEAIRDGKAVPVAALSDPEELTFDDPPGRCEAFITTGGSSTMVASFTGRLRTLDYKTVRYPGHRDRVLLLRELGLMDDDPVPPYRGGEPVAPRDVLATLLETRIPQGVPDLVVLRVEARDAGGRGVRLDVREFSDPATGFSAMERCTAFPSAAVAAAQARGDVPAGAHAPESAVDPDTHLSDVRARGLTVQEAPLT